MSQPLKRIQQYEDMGIGLFIHWGLYSQLSVGEWTEYIHERNQQKYEQLIDRFTASDFNADDIVAQAKRMGAKYIVLTTKHHEGFFLYDTHGLSDFDVMHSPAKRDLISEFVSACRKNGIKPFFYMATYDWHSPLYEHDFDAYLEYLRKSVEILAKNYGPVGGFWFDGNWNKKTANWKLDELYGTIRRYQPDAMIINNTGLKNRGKISNQEIDAVTYERHTPDLIYHGENDGKYVAGETSLTLNQHWGYATQDLDYKSPREVIENVAHARHVGANILVNIGLDGTGNIIPIQRSYMELLGKWTAMAHDALYKTRPDSERLSNGHPRDFVLTDSNNSYLFIQDLGVVGNENVVLGGEGSNLRSFVGFYDKITKISWLDNQQPIHFMQDSQRGTLTIDANGYSYGRDWVIRIAKVDLKK
ncbi:alpha-L-fucosidase [Lactiplantibacillus fabifermentans]|nr:alpha-L-fucosidase [Lactiplantibacillus fabifermentans]